MRLQGAPQIPPLRSSGAPVGMTKGRAVCFSNASRHRAYSATRDQLYADRHAGANHRPVVNVEEADIYSFYHLKDGEPDAERPEGPLTGPERPMLQAFLDWQRATLLYKCAGLTGEQLARRAIPPSELSLLGLLRHMTKVERVWFRMRFAGEQVNFPFGRDFQAEFEGADPARAAADYARLTEEIKHADAAAANASLDDTFTSNGEVMSLRMIYLHMIEEYARHLGHADLLREQIDGVTGE